MNHDFSKPCPCGSGQQRFALYDARGIFVSYVCVDCEEKVKGKYRPEIFDNPGYDTMGEQVEDDY